MKPKSETSVRDNPRLKKKNNRLIDVPSNQYNRNLNDQIFDIQIIITLAD